MDRRWSDPWAVLDALTRIAGAVRADLLAVPSAEIADLVLHRAALLRTADCAREPVKAVGDAGTIDALDADRLRALTAMAEPGAPARVLSVDIAGPVRRVVVLAEAPVTGRDVALVLVGGHDRSPTRGLSVMATPARTARRAPR